ncbi:hypothetical protein KJ969_03840 [Patescibacteria group bacterium]|nr:hypothetical protein [Patescibacteria group bacterium]MBU1921751.1 hypothetical protein [Patescibacteria group bacterium]
MLKTDSPLVTPRGKNFSEVAPSEIFGQGPISNSQKRRCKEPSCDTVLSRYNRSDYCYAHRWKDKEFQKGKAKKPRVRCRHCGKYLNKHGGKEICVSCADAGREEGRAA